MERQAPRRSSRPSLYSCACENVRHEQVRPQQALSRGPRPAARRRRRGPERVLTRGFIARAPSATPRASDAVSPADKETENSSGPMGRMAVREKDKTFRASNATQRSRSSCDTREARLGKLVTQEINVQNIKNSVAEILFPESMCITIPVSQGINTTFFMYKSWVPRAGEHTE